VSHSRPPVCDYEGSDYQERFWDSGERAYEDAVEELALGRLLPPGNGRLLEVGAGTGRNSLRYRGYRQVVLLDYSRSQLEQAQARLGLSDAWCYVAGDAYRLPFAPAVFEAATMIRTLHHMAEPLATLKQVRGCLAAGGQFILEYPNKHNLKAMIRWAVGHQEWNPFDRQPIEFAHLNFDFHPAAVRHWLQTAGFKVERQLTVSHFRTPLLKHVLPLPLLLWLDGLAQWTGALWQLSPSVFVRARAEGDAVPASEAFWRCPGCGGLAMDEQASGVRCKGCNRLWGIRDGIYDFKQPIQGPAI
jgi:SAM-dependent methyltransferase